MSGSPRSSTTTSGSSSSTSVIAATPVLASPTISNPPRNLSAVRTRRRASGASSTSSTRTGSVASVSTAYRSSAVGRVTTNAWSPGRYAALAALGARELADDVEPQPGAALAAGREALEQLGPHPLRDARRRRPGRRWTCSRVRLDGDVDRRLPVAEAVADQVLDDLREPVLVGQDARRRYVGQPDLAVVRPTGSRCARSAGAARPGRARGCRGRARCSGPATP